MLSRTKEFWLVAFFLSKFGNVNNRQQTEPPVEFETTKWNEAYRMFYEKLGGGRTISSFEHSLKNARDSYDSHIKSSNRIGWMNNERKPNMHSNSAKIIYDKYSTIDRNEIWNELLLFANKVWFFGECCEPKFLKEIKKVSKLVGFDNCWLAYTWDKKTDKTNLSYNEWNNFIGEIQKLNIA